MNDIAYTCYNLPDCVKLVSCPARARLPARRWGLGTTVDVSHASHTLRIVLFLNGYVPIGKVCCDVSQDGSLAAHVPK